MIHAQRKPLILFTHLIMLSFILVRHFALGNQLSAGNMRFVAVDSITSMFNSELKNLFRCPSLPNSRPHAVEATKLIATPALHFPRRQQGPVTHIAKKTIHSNYT